MTESDMKEILDVLEDEYYSIGITSGHEAIGNLLEDFFNGRLDDNLTEWGTSKHEFHTEIFWFLAKRWFDDGKLWKSVDEFYS